MFRLFCHMKEFTSTLKETHNMRVEFRLLHVTREQLGVDIHLIRAEEIPCGAQLWSGPWLPKAATEPDPVPGELGLHPRGRPGSAAASVCI